MLYRFLLSLLIVVPSFSVFSESPCPDKKDGDLIFLAFSVKDFSRDIYYATIKAPNKENLLSVLKVKDETLAQLYNANKKPEVLYKSGSNEWLKIDDLDSSIVLKIKDLATGELIQIYPTSGSIQYAVGFFSFGVNLTPDSLVTSGRKCIEIYKGENLQHSYFYEFPDRKIKPNEQPILLENDGIIPKGATLGDTVTIRGKNLGDSIDDIVVYLISATPDNSYDNGEKELAEIYPLTLSMPDENKIQESKFTIPNDIFLKEQPTFLKKLIGTPMHLRVIVNNRPTTLEDIVILNKNWKFSVGILSLFITLAFLGFVGIILKKINFFPAIFLDSKTNSYSLSRVQSFAWTLTLFGSYFFVATCYVLILQNGKIPDFNFSLIGLLVISYTGLGASLQMESKIIPVRKEKPEWKDLFYSQGEGLDLTKVQLFGFTFIAIALFLVNLFEGNIMKGLPDIPTTLHALLATSQGGYLTGKLTSNKTMPSSEQITEPKIETSESKNLETEVESKPVK